MTFISWHIAYYDWVFANELWWREISAVCFFVAFLIARRAQVTRALSLLGCIGVLFCLWFLCVLQILLVLLAGPTAWIIVGLFAGFSGMMYLTRPDRTALGVQRDHN
ncbi:MAG: hypothetical protein AAFY56_16840 [Pseudomonadota bacterium]